VNAADVNNKVRTELAWRKEQPLKRGVAQILRVQWPVGPGDREGVQKILVGVTNPKSRLRGEPVQPAQPARRGFQPRVVEDFRLVGRHFGLASTLLCVALPLSSAMVT